MAKLCERRMNQVFFHTELSERVWSCSLQQQQQENAFQDFCLKNQQQQRRSMEDVLKKLAAKGGGCGQQEFGQDRNKMNEEK